MKLIIGFGILMAGALVFTLYCCLVAASRADRQMEAWVEEMEKSLAESTSSEKSEE